MRMPKPKTPESPVPAISPDPSVPAFDPIPMKPRHNGWSDERQRAFIGALADTGNVTTACRYVNMSTTQAYRLRRHPAAESFRRAWDAALDFGVRRLKDELYERALEGQLKPVFVGGKLKGFQRVKNDRLLMFALRMNARDERGQRMSASYFDPGAARLHGGSGYSDGGERSKQIAPAPLGEGVGAGGILPSSLRSTGEAGTSAAVGRPKRLGASLTIPTPTRAEKDDRNAIMVEHFDPVALTLPEIEAMQAALVEEAARKRADEEAGRVENMTGVAFIQNRDEDAFKALGTLEDIEPVVFEEDREAEFDAEEDRWWDLSEGD